VPNKRYNSIDEIIEELRGKTVDEVIAEVRAEPWEGPTMITRDMLIASGALNVRRGPRKNKDEAPRPLFGQLDDNDVPAEDLPASDEDDTE